MSIDLSGIQNIKDLVITLSNLDIDNNQFQPLWDMMQGFADRNEVFATAVDTVNKMVGIDLAGVQKIPDMLTILADATVDQFQPLWDIMQGFADRNEVFATAVDTINKLVGIDLAGVQKIPDMLTILADVTVDKFQPLWDIMQGFADRNEVFATAVDSINKLAKIDLAGVQKLHDMVAKLSDITVQSVQPIWDIMEKMAHSSLMFVQALSVLKQMDNVDQSSIDTLKSILKAVSDVDAQNLQGLSSVLSGPEFGANLGKMISVSAPPAPVQSISLQNNDTGGVTSGITTDMLNKSTMAYYEKQNQQLTRMIELLEQANDKHDEGKASTERGFDDLASAMQKIGRV
jgi:cytochrome c556